MQRCKEHDQSKGSESLMTPPVKDFSAFLNLAWHRWAACQVKTLYCLWLNMEEKNHTQVFNRNQTLQTQCLCQSRVNNQGWHKNETDLPSCSKENSTMREAEVLTVSYFIFIVCPHQCMFWSNSFFLIDISVMVLNVFNYQVLTF